MIKFLDRFCCPVCHGKLDEAMDGVSCIACDRRYRVADAIPVLRESARIAEEDHFDEVSTQYDESMPAHVIQHYLDKRATFLKRVVPSGSVLDVGCGTGTLLEHLGPENHDRVGIDASEGMLNVFAGRCEIPIAASDADLLPFTDDSFDLTYCVAVLHHLEEPSIVSGCLKEMWRVTKPGGYVLIWDHNPLNPYWPLLMRRVPQDIGTERLVGMREVRAGLAPHGMTIWHKRMGFVPDFTPRKALKAVARLEGFAESIPGLRLFAAHNVVVARKNHSG